MYGYVDRIHFNRFQDLFSAFPASAMYAGQLSRLCCRLTTDQLIKSLLQASQLIQPLHAVWSFFLAADAGWSAYLTLIRSA